MRVTRAVHPSGSENHRICQEEGHPNDQMLWITGHPDKGASSFEISVASLPYFIVILTKNWNKLADLPISLCSASSSITEHKQRLDFSISDFSQSSLLALRHEDVLEAYSVHESVQNWIC